MKTLQNNPFIRDDYGNLIGIHQQSVNGSVDIPIEKVIVSKSYVGYNGGLQLIEDLYSGVLDKGFIAHTTVEK